MKKLEYVDEVMEAIAQQPPVVRSRQRPDALSRLRMTLREYYERKQRWYGNEHPGQYDRHLLRFFSPDPRGVSGPRLS